MGLATPTQCVAPPYRASRLLAEVRRPVLSLWRSRYHIDVIIAVPPRVVPLRSESNPAAVWRPRRTTVPSGVVCELGNIRTVDVHHIDVIIAVPIGSESNPTAVRRPYRIMVPSSAVCELGDSQTVGVHRIDFKTMMAAPIGSEGNPAAVWRHTARCHHFITLTAVIHTHTPLVATTLSL